MFKPYYIQVIADNYLKNLMPDTALVKVHDRFLHGLDTDQFKAGYLALLSLMRNLYADISMNPGSFGMLLKENTERYANNSDFRNSEASFLRMPHALLILGAKAALQPDLTMTIDGDDMLTAAKALKLPNTALSVLLTKMKDYGFEINGLGKSIKSGDVITLSYTDCRALTTALKAMAEALLEMNKDDIKKPKYLFYTMHPGILENQVVKEPKLTVETILRVLAPADQAYAAALHKHVADITKQAIRCNGSGICCNIWTCTYTGIKNKKVLMSLHVDQESFSVKLNLYHISKYMSLVKELPEKMRESIRSCGWSCGDCNARCAGGFVFEMDGNQYNKCRCGAFVFGSLTAEDIDGCQKLLTEELLYAD